MRGDFIWGVYESGIQGYYLSIVRLTVRFFVLKGFLFLENLMRIALGDKPIL